MEYSLEFFILINILKLYGYSTKVAFQAELKKGGINPGMYASVTGYMIGLVLFSPAYVLHDLVIQQTEAQVKNKPGRTLGGDDGVNCRAHDHTIHQVNEPRILGRKKEDVGRSTGGEDYLENRDFKRFNFFSTLRARSFKGVFSRVFDYKATQ